MNKLETPFSYQGGKSRLSKNIVDIIFENENINNDTKFFDLCCGAGSYSIELLNRGINPKNIFMIDSGLCGLFWEMVSKNKFDINKMKETTDNLPDIKNIKKYLENISKNNVNQKNKIYDYIILQAGAFGSKQIYEKDGIWKNCSFRNYWEPTKNSNRKSPVNPMMPMPKTLFDRIEKIVNNLSGKINAYNDFIQNHYDWFDYENDSNVIIYCDPPYKNTTKYGFKYNPYELVFQVWNNAPIYISEGYSMDGIEKSWLLSNGRKKGNISGNISKSPTQEWLNKFY